MHGIILAELTKYVGARLGRDAWSDVLERAGMPGEAFLATTEYPDETVVRIVDAASEMAGLSSEAILEDFGEFIAPDLVRIYAAFIKPEWRTLDLIDNTEETIHRAVRLRDPGAKPPELKTERPSEREVVVVYGSERKMCSVAKGIVKGVAAHYGERVHLSEETCMLQGATECRIHVQALRGAS